MSVCRNDTQKVPRAFYEGLTNTVSYTAQWLKSSLETVKRMCWLVFRYSSTHEKALPNRPLRCRVGVHRASPAYSKSCRTRSRT